MSAPVVVYDTGQLVAADRGRIEALRLHERLLRRGGQPLVPAVVLAQAWRGGQHARLSRVLKGCAVVPDDEHVARAAGALCARTGTADVVDAIVVVTARVLGAALVTSDPDDLTALVGSLDWKPLLFVV